MSNFLYIPNLNPIRFIDPDQVHPAQYNTKHLDDYLFEDTQYPWNNQTFYNRKWQKNDTIFLQFESNFGLINVNVLDQYDIQRLSFTATPKRANIYMAGYYVYEVEIALASLAEGFYRLKLTAGTKTLISGWLDIRTLHKYTLLLEYKNSRYHQDVVFETGIRFGFRVEGTIGKLKPGSKDTYYEDEPLNPVVTSSKPFETWPLQIGGARGVPDDVVKLWNLIWTCNNVLVDGKEFAKSSDSKLDLRETDRYPMRGIFMDVREGVNRASKIISPDVDTSKRIIVNFNINGKLFGDISGQGGTNITPITDIE